MKTFFLRGPFHLGQAIPDFSLVGKSSFQLSTFLELFRETNSYTEIMKHSTSLQQLQVKLLNILSSDMFSFTYTL